jgi:hypothetical protein
LAVKSGGDIIAKIEDARMSRVVSKLVMKGRTSLVFSTSVKSKKPR